MRTKAVAALLLSAFVWSGASASPIDADSPCYSSDRYSVAVLENDDAPGARFAISAASGDGTCRFDESGPMQIIGNGEEPLWFSDIQGKFLILSRSTGPQGDLVVYDLESGVKVLDVPSDDFEAYEGGVTFWQRTVDATEKNCPNYAEFEADGLGAMIVERAHYDFASGTIERADEERCDPVQ